MGVDINMQENGPVTLAFSRGHSASGSLLLSYGADCNLGPAQDDFDPWKVLKQCLSGMEFSNVMTIDSEMLSRDEFNAVVAGVLGNDANENPFECEVTCVDFSGTAAELLGIEPDDDES
jgi:hypothetical protein